MSCEGAQPAADTESRARMRPEVPVELRSRHGVGDHVLLRQKRGRSSWCFMPVTVLESTERVVLRLAAGTKWLAAVDREGRRAKTFDPDWKLEVLTWTTHDATWFIRPGRRACLIAFSPPGCKGDVAKWYVNCQQPLETVEFGFETLDLELDLEKYPGDRQYRWKDLDDFAVLLRCGLISVTDGRAVLEDACLEAREARLTENDPTTKLLLRTAAAAPDLVPLLDRTFAHTAAPDDAPWWFWRTTT